MMTLFVCLQSENTFVSIGLVPSCCSDRLLLSVGRSKCDAKQTIPSVMYSAISA